MRTIPAGQTARVTVEFTPQSGTISLADVTARALECRTSTVTTLTPVAGGVDAGVYTFYADVEIPDSAGSGRWVVRFESNSPSPKMSIEDDSTSFMVKGSELPNP